MFEKVMYKFNLCIVDSCYDIDIVLNILEVVFWINDLEVFMELEIFVVF